MFLSTLIHIIHINKCLGQGPHRQVNMSQFTSSWQAIVYQSVPPFWVIFKELRYQNTQGREQRICPQTLGIPYPPTSPHSFKTCFSPGALLTLTPTGDPPVHPGSRPACPVCPAQSSLALFSHSFLPHLPKLQTWLLSTTTLLSRLSHSDKRNPLTTFSLFSNFLNLCSVRYSALSSWNSILFWASKSWMLVFFLCFPQVPHLSLWHPTSEKDRYYWKDALLVLQIKHLPQTKLLFLLPSHLLARPES